MSYQFIHVEGYGRKASSVSNGKNGQTVRSIVAEAERRSGACPHVKEVRKPNLLYGIAPSKVADLAEHRATKATDSRGRKLRKDALIMLAGVVSYPASYKEAMEDEEIKADFIRWKNATVDFLKKEYGDELKSIVMHTDESHLHVHFFCVEGLKRYTSKKGDELIRFGIDDIHPGRKARAKVTREGGPRKEQALAYTDAMRDFQDSFFNTVSKFFGHVRLGPQRRRLSRAEYNREKAQASALKLVFNEAKKWQEKYVKKIKRLQQKYLKDIETLKVELDSYKAQRDDLPAYKFNQLLNENNDLKVKNTDLKKQLQLKDSKIYELAKYNEQLAERNNEYVFKKYLQR